MRDFDKRFQRMEEDFDKSWKVMRTLSVVWFIFVALIAVAILGGAGYAIFKLLVFFGVM